MNTPSVKTFYTEQEVLSLGNDFFEVEDPKHMRVYRYYPRHEVNIVLDLTQDVWDECTPEACAELKSLLRAQGMLPPSQNDTEIIMDPVPVEKPLFQPTANQNQNRFKIGPFGFVLMIVAGAAAVVGILYAVFGGKKAVATA